MVAHVPKHDSRGLQRIITALQVYAPKWVTFTDVKEAADIVIFLTNGRREGFERKIQHLRKRQSYAIVQIAIKSTMSPSVHQWMDVWKGAQLVWSYYDLQQQCHDEQASPLPRFYHAPLGVDQTAFKHDPTLQLPDDRFLVGTTGLSVLSEGVREANLGAATVGRRAFHIGSPKALSLGSHTTQLFNISDQELTRYYNSTDYVCALRRVEGFELPAAEGLICGARPLLFRRPHYTQWFRQWGVYVHEQPRPEVLQAVTNLFRRPIEPLSSCDISAAKKLFDWQTIIPEFWERCRNPFHTLGPKQYVF